MVIANLIKDKLASVQCGVVLSIADFCVEPQYQQALVMSLCRLVKQGELRKISKGKYYKPKKSIFGTLTPNAEETVKDFLQKDNQTIGYITGTAAFAQMGLTTQISSAILIGTNKYRGKLSRGENTISFLLQPNPIRDEDISLLRILDAIRLFKEIPASSPDEVIRQIMVLVSKLSKLEQERLVELAIKYPPFVKAIMGAIMEQVGVVTLSYRLRYSLNGVTYYKLPISDNVLPNKKNWRIL